MLGRKNLIPLKKEFSRIRKEGRLYDSPSFGLLVSFGSKFGSQAAFIVSKKINKRSTVRHEVKRKLSDAVSPLLLRIAKNLELVFLAKQKATTATREELKKEVESVLTRARFI